VHPLLAMQCTTGRHMNAIATTRILGGSIIPKHVQKPLVLFAMSVKG
jgi:hypothetical protein